MKATAAATAAAGAFQYVFDPAVVAAYESDPNYTVLPTTCPYCSASCGQRVVVHATSGVVDIYGDYESIFNQGGLCAKGAGSLQLVNNARRIGAWTFPYGGHANHPVSGVFEYNATYGTSGIAYKRIGNGDWTPMALDTALAEAATALSGARNAHTAGFNPSSGLFNSKAVAFFGSSHMNNEQNWIYRKIIANFGTSNTEHQARI